LTPEAELAALSGAPQTKRATVVIVSLNRAAQLKQLLAGLGENYQIIVVDNGSTDGALDLEPMFPAVRFIRLPRNFGLTKALNLGVRAADSELVLLLHDDVRISGSAVGLLADAMESRPDAGAACPLLTTASGEPAPQVRSLPTPATPDPPFKTATGDTAECVSTAAMMVRASFLRAMRYFDESYGAYGSALDVCWQLRHAQKKILILRDVPAIHDASPSPVKPEKLAGDRVAGTATFLGKRHGAVAGLLYRLKKGLAALFTFRFSVVAGAFSGTKIDGTS
jgi:GT2 family glycosyltransferase